MLALVDKAKLDTKWPSKHGRHTLASTGNKTVLQTAKHSAALRQNYEEEL